MSDKNMIPESFDIWISETLTKGPVINPAFTQTIIRRAERLNAQKLLRKVVWQERIARGMLILASAALLGILCCPPILSRVYTCLETALKRFILLIMEPSAPILLTFAALLTAVLYLLAKTIWDNLVAE